MEEQYSNNVACSQKQSIKIIQTTIKPSKIIIFIKNVTTIQQSEHNKTARKDNPSQKPKLTKIFPFPCCKIPSYRLLKRILISIQITALYFVCLGVYCFNIPNLDSKVTGVFTHPCGNCKHQTLIWGNNCNLRGGNTISGDVVVAAVYREIGFDSQKIN